MDISRTEFISELLFIAKHISPEFELEISHSIDKYPLHAVADRLLCRLFIEGFDGWEDLSGNMIEAIEYLREALKEHSETGKVLFPS